MREEESAEGFDDLIARARAGADSAWRVIYRSTSPAINGYLRAKGARDPEDLLGEVYFHAAKSVHDFSGDERAFRAWLFAIARNRIIDDARRRTRRPDEVTVAVTPEPAAGDAEEDSLRRISTEEVRALLSKLPERQQDVLLLRILGDLTIDEIARILKKTPGSVKALQRRGTKRLKRYLSDPYPHRGDETL